MSKAERNKNNPPVGRAVFVFVYGNPMLGNVYKKISAISVDIKAMVTHQQSWWFCICGQSPMILATPQGVGTV